MVLYRRGNNQTQSSVRDRERERGRKEQMHNRTSNFVRRSIRFSLNIKLFCTHLATLVNVKKKYKLTRHTISGFISKVL